MRPLPSQRRTNGAPFTPSEIRDEWGFRDCGAELRGEGLGFSFKWQIRIDDSSNAKNPLPNHVDNGVDVRQGRGLFISDSRGNHGETRNHCEFHHEKGHETQESVKFKALAPGMMDDKEMKLCEEIKEEKNIHTMLASVHTNDIYEDKNEKEPC
ncbi:hypothetical protein GOBAR_DD26596 [Gossypium barbadense]|nr:hypothetical protein GOBAR_DD26596 [Gossypium barbadense]